MKLTGVISFFIAFLTGALINAWWAWVSAPTCGLRVQHGMSFAAYAFGETAMLTLIGGGLCLGVVAALLIRKACCW